MAGPYNLMQQAAGILPGGFMPPQNPLIYPGMVSANMAIGGQGGFGAGMFPTQQWQTFTNQPAMTQGPTGVMMPGMPSAPYNPYAPAGLGGQGPIAPRLYGPGVPQPPPAYAGPQGRMNPLFGPSPAPAYFENPFQAGLSQEQATQDRYFRGAASGYGMLGRFGVDAIGAGIGGMIGRRFGMGGVGAAAGAMASEYFGAGAWGQNATMNNVVAPAVNMRAYAAGIQNVSQSFVGGGEFSNVSGSGFSHAASVRSARLLEDMATAPSFQRETQEKFNRADVMKITQLGAKEGLLNGTQNPQQLQSRVRDLAKSLSTFMELANEPDIQRAIQTMGQMRASGLNYSETIRSVQNGRAWARMAGTTFEQLSATGGSYGSQTYGAMGLTQGLGFQTGMGNYGLTRMGQNTGVVSPQMMALMGGTDNAANLSNMFSASFLQMPMLAPAMMNGRGGLDINSLRGLMSGRANMFNMPGQGISALGGMTRSMGVEGLGLAVALQPMMQESIGRVMESQGPFARRNVEDQQILGFQRSMGQRGAAGFVMAGQAMGLDRTQSLARAREIGSSDFYDQQHDQVEALRRERRSEYLRDVEARRPSTMDYIASESSSINSLREGYRGARAGIRNLYEDLSNGNPYAGTQFTTRESRDRFEQYSREHGAEALSRSHVSRSEVENTWGARYNADRAVYAGSGARGSLLTVGSMISATFGDDATRAEEVLCMRRIGNMGQNLLNTSSEEATRAQGFLNRQGVSNTDMLRFGASIGDLSGRTQTPFGGVIGAGLMNAGLSMGSRYVTGLGIDPIAGQRMVSTGQMGEAFAASTGRSQEFFNQNQRTVLQGASPYARAFMDSRGLDQWNRAVQATQALGGASVDIEGTERNVYRGVLGEGANSSRERRALDRISDTAQGVGRGAVAEKSRQALAVIRTLQTQINGPDGSRARARMREVTEELFRTGGLSQSEQTAFLSQMEITNNSQMNDQDARTAGRDMMGLNVSGKELLTRFSRAEGGRNEATYLRRFRMGAEILGNQGGLMGALFNGATDGASFQRNIAAVAGNEGLMETGTAEERALVRRANAGDQRAIGELANKAQVPGRQGERAEQRFDSRWYARLFSMNQSFFDTKDSFRRREGARGTPADRDAERSDEAIETTRREARNQGIGGDMDQLAEVTRNLAQVTRSLEHVVESNAVTNLMGSGS